MARKKPKPKPKPKRAPTHWTNSTWVLRCTRGSNLGVTRIFETRRAALLGTVVPWPADFRPGDTFVIDDTGLPEFGIWPR